MKKLIIACLLIVTGAGAYAQKPATKPAPAPKTPEQRADAVASHFEKKLTLSKEQKTKVHDLALSRAVKMDALRAKYKDQGKEVWQAERKKTHSDFHSGIKALLTPEQLVKWEEQRKQAKEKHKAGHWKGKGNHHGKDVTPKTPEQRADAVADHFEKQLTLSKEQKAKVRDLSLARNKKMEELRTTYKDQDKKVWQGERKKTEETFRSGVKNLLSAEQAAKWEAQRKEAMEKRKEGNCKGKGNHHGKKGSGSAAPDAKPGESKPGDK